ncbi:MAG: RNA 2',3'-cyclic phosphodiesterase [bacterium]|nr:RNA 2',3'-cyclic phosphodiesterase [bacterium]MDD5354459.1 RNA 2',3'-cyclic phosphodiesterase [bacterium]MDD5756350.1 RNA 2',3'-cyclic phosphodiesterase [bacterium]
MRVFVSVGIDPEIKEKVAEVQDQLKLANADVRWVAKENLHLTLHFCGEVNEKKAQDIITVCRGIASEISPFSLEIKYVGTYPPYGDPRIIWTGVEQGRDEAITLIEVTKRHLTLLTGVTEKKDISPHLTFGRIRTTTNIGVLTTQLHKFANLGFGVQTVDKILVMESKLKPTGPVYSVLEEIKLAEKK